ncbi:MAG: hypothetical protein A2287_09835 [Candidatus Melainabacteria bacterium RIFOXYA12_FULL_32_12]|nr:MAG: hypothetical protein A2255_00075 [Candidatus Melainabacteria bacterium RIFOXYA2_FULL_32_9]OGI28125.1 MAG: hypothetical protein A2287_09835 [Candidatus Melainabacteria bacterium RIFOXYA12_FULL_32_12]
MHTNNINIILPNRIGDSILTLPAIACLKQLLNKYGPENSKITIFPAKVTAKIIQSFDLFPTKEINLLTKLKSWISPPDKAFFLYNSSQNLGYYAKTSYGCSSGKYKYSNDLDYLIFNNTKERLSNELVTFLQDKYQLSMAAISYFGICLDLGYSSEQILSTFEFNSDSLTPIKEFSNWQPPFINSKYMVICMEAAYGKKVDANRRWPENNFLELADKIHKNFNIPCIFIGIDDKPSIPDKTYFIDLRKKLDITQVAQLLKYASGYIGNDSGPLHLANLIRKHSICIGLIPAAKTYEPIFKEFYHSIWNPENADSIIPIIEEILSLDKDESIT